MSEEAEDMLWYLPDHFLPVSVWQGMQLLGLSLSVEKELKLDSFIHSFYQLYCASTIYFPLYSGLKMQQ